MADQYVNPYDDLLNEDNRLDEELDTAAIDTEPVEAPKTTGESDNAIINYDRALDDDITDEDIKTLEQPGNPYETIIESQTKPIINTPEDDDDEGAWNKVKELGLSFYQGAWDGFEEIGFTVADLADAAFDMDDPEYFRKYAESIQWQDKDSEAANRAIMQSSTSNALVGGAGRFLSGFIPALKALQVFKASGKVMPWMKKVIGTGVAGAGSDFAVWDYTDKRVADYLDSFGDEVLTEYAQEFQNNPEDAGTLDNLKKQLAEVMTSKYMKALKYNEKTDSKLMARTKQAIEGFVIGKVVDPIIGALRIFARTKKGSAIKSYGKTSKEGELATDIKQTIDKYEPDYKPVGKGVKVSIEGETKAGRVLAMSEDGTTATVKVGNETKDVAVSKLQSETKMPMSKSAKAALKNEQDRVLPKKQQTSFNQAYASGNFSAASKIIASHVDDEILDQIVDIQSMDRVLSEVTELAENSIQETRTWKQAAIKSADEATKKDTQGLVKQASRKTKDLDSSILSINILDKALAKRLHEAAIQRTSGKITREQFKNVASHAYAMSQYAKQVNGEVGRALNIIKFTNKEGRLDTNRMFNEMSNQGWNNLDDAARRISRVDPNVDTSMLDALGERSFMKAGTEAFINSVLSPTSLGINITSNIIMMLARTADIHMAAIRGSGGITHKQAFAHTAGYLSAIPEAFMTMLRSFKNDVAEFSGKGWSNEFKPKAAITAENLGFRKANPKQNLSTFKKTVNGTINTVGKVIRGVPGGVRSMMATDEFFKVLNHRAYTMKMAIETVEQEGVNLFRQPSQFSKSVRTKFNSIKEADALKAKSGDLDALLNQQAMEEAHLATFTNSWDKGAERVYQTLRSQPWTSLILPFVRQPVNNMLYLAKSTPGLNLLSRRMSKEIAAGGARAEIALAHLNVASMVWATAVLMAFGEGGKLQGNPKGDTGWSAEGRDIGVDPNTFQNEEGNFVNYRGGEPIAGRWAIAAGLMHQWMKIMNEAGPEMTDEEVEQAGWDMVLAGSLTVIDNFKDQSSLRGLENTLAMFEGGTETSFKRRAEIMLSGWISVLSGQIKYIREQYLGEDQYKYKPEGLAQAVDARYGGAFSDAINVMENIPDLNSFGDVKPGAHPQMLGEVLGNDSQLNPLNYIPTNIRETQGFTEEWQKEIVALRQKLPGETVIGRVPTRIEEVKIDNRERHNLLKFLKYHKVNGRTLASDMTDLIKSREYKKAPDRLKANLIHDVYSGHMKVAKQMLIMDAEKFYKNPVKHQKSSHWKKYGLVPYGRSQSLYSIAQRQKAKDTNRLLDLDDKDRINIKSFEEESKNKVGSAYDRMRKLFQ